MRLLAALGTYNGPSRTPAPQQIVMTSRPGEYEQARQKRGGEGTGAVRNAVTIAPIARHKVLNAIQAADPPTGQLAAQIARRPALAEMVEVSLWLSLAVSVYSTDPTRDP